MSDNTVALWDVKNKKVLRRIRGHSARVGCLAWNNFILSTGSCDSTIMNHDVRAKESLLATLKGHEQEICGLQWDSNTDGTYLASGGNDNVACVWEYNQLSANEPTPKCVLRESRAAVKALAWCPWQKALLAAGGGTGDMHIRFYDVNSGNCFNEVNTQSQVCSLQWNPFDKEILSSHGFSKYQLSIWKYPSLIKTHDLTGHTSRVLHTVEFFVTLSSRFKFFILLFVIVLVWKKKKKKKKRRCPQMAQWSVQVLLMKLCGFGKFLKK
ncbi:hypothetical protein RFI_13846 [Reticulomyxa filosa]|uniref:CDC20/Fizzy WD40 domain-containing protein n=1 Tax=Reticulomyxa filosa TaxID=46433 RepID=X6NDD4_RETFI|nr:hypothetical protein RFI_13846 [Reticulomyxa filosa]|eukprot:ETO23337.1 hypothetical protein RFI_13846 [Reticulomyxa filosa]